MNVLRVLCFGLGAWGLVLGASGQMVTTYDTRTGIEPVRSRHVAVDIGTLDGEDAQPWMRMLAAPALIDVETRLGVAITGTVAEARSELSAMIRAARPAREKARGRRIDGDAEATRTNLLGVISRSSGTAQRNAIVAYLEWLTFEVEAVKEGLNSQ